MRLILSVFFATLLVFSFVAAQEVVPELLAAPEDPTPEDGALGVELPLELRWDVVPGALSYRYELVGYKTWLQEQTQQEKTMWEKEWIDKDIKDWVKDGRENGFLVSQSRSDSFDSSILAFFEPQHSYRWYVDTCNEGQANDDRCDDEEIQAVINAEQAHAWRVKSCGDEEGMDCGSFSAEWTFVYLPLPGTLGDPDGTGISSPLSFEWDPVIGANSYNFSIKPCPKSLEEEFEKEGEPCEIFSFTVQEPPYEDSSCILEPLTSYNPGWSVSACLDSLGSFCGPKADPHPFFIFTTEPDSLPLSFPVGPLYTPDDPATPAKNEEVIPVVSQNDALSWNTETGRGCAYGYHVVITSPKQEIEIRTNQFVSGNALGNIEELWNEDDLNQIWEWQVFSCARPDGFLCEDTGSKIWKFKTTGAPPVLENPKAGESVKIPFTLKWSNERGTSYKYELSLNGLISSNPDDKGSFENTLKDAVTITINAEISYEEGIIAPDTQYWWHVKTCVDSEGEVCGGWNESRTFSTHPLNPPPGPKIPLHEGKLFLPESLSWQAAPGANYYQYQVQYTPLKPDSLEGCTEIAGSFIIPPGKSPPIPTTQETSFFLTERCLGEYQWQVGSCLDKECTVAAPTNIDDAPLWTFTAVPHPSPGAGIVPCDRLSDEKSTPYDEREQCQVKHLGFLLQNILDFVLWKLSLIILAVLAVFVAASTYFSFGSPDVIMRIRSVFRSYFYGVLVLLFAWAIVNIIMAVFGFNIEFFGRWYEIPF